MQHHILYILFLFSGFVLAISCGANAGKGNNMYKDVYEFSCPLPTGQNVASTLDGWPESLYNGEHLMSLYLSVCNSQSEVECWYYPKDVANITPVGEYTCQNLDDGDYKLVVWTME